MISDILDSFRLEPGVWQICLRLLCAMVVGLVIGTEREYTNRPAGMRTHVLVALGACVVAITGQMLHFQYNSGDPARLAAQVITGVGFLGAGTILREGASVKGLTTAASVWTVACLGIAAGFGYYPIALCGMVFMLITLTILEFFQHRLPGRNQSHEEDYALDCVDVAAALTAIHDGAQTNRAQLREILAAKQEGGYRVTFRAAFHGAGAKKRRERFFAVLAANPHLTAVQQGKERV
ncbi:MAG: MgtC/SapB family protein [Oscillospiraceae bacterium]|nr:MgtC/SapB family protein [Oscillospiraceae bacterium]